MKSPFRQLNISTPGNGVSGQGDYSRSWHHTRSDASVSVQREMHATPDDSSQIATEAKSLLTAIISEHHKIFPQTPILFPPLLNVLGLSEVRYRHDREERTWRSRRWTKYLKEFIDHASLIFLNISSKLPFTDFCTHDFHGTYCVPCGCCPPSSRRPSVWVDGSFPQGYFREQGGFGYRSLQR